MPLTSLLFSVEKILKDQFGLPLDAFIIDIETDDGWLVVETLEGDYYSYSLS